MNINMFVINYSIKRKGHTHTQTLDKQYLSLQMLYFVASSNVYDNDAEVKISNGYSETEILVAR